MYKVRKTLFIQQKQIISGWKHGRALQTGICWAVLREIDARVSVSVPRLGPGSQV